MSLLLYFQSIYCKEKTKYPIYPKYWYISTCFSYNWTTPFDYLGPDVQSIVSLTSSLRVISSTVLADSIYNILIFFAEKM